MHTTILNHSSPRVGDICTRLKWQLAHRRMTLTLALIVAITSFQIGSPPSTHATTPADTNTEQDTQITTTTSTKQSSSTTSPTGNSNTTTTDTTNQLADDTTSTLATGEEPATSTTSSATAEQTTTTPSTQETATTTLPTTIPADGATSTTTDNPSSTIPVTPNSEATTTTVTSKTSTTNESNNLITNLRRRVPRQSPTGTTQPSTTTSTISTSLEFPEPSHNLAHGEAYNRVSGQETTTINLPKAENFVEPIFYVLINLRNNGDIVTDYSFPQSGQSNPEVLTLIIRQTSNIFSQNVIGKFLLRAIDSSGSIASWTFGVRGYDPANFATEPTVPDHMQLSQGRRFDDINLPKVSIVPPDQAEQHNNQENNQEDSTDRCIERSYSISPVLPNGLNFNSTLLTISGTPRDTISQSYTYTASVKLYPTAICSNINSAGEDQSKWIVTVDKSLIFRLTVEQNRHPLIRNSHSQISTVDRIQRSVDFTYGAFKTKRIGQYFLGNGDNQFEVNPNLPNGISLSQELEQVYLYSSDWWMGTIYIHGRPLEVMSSTVYTITVTDRDGESIDINLALSIARDVQPTVNDYTGTIQLMTGIEMSHTISYSGGNQPLYFRLSPSRSDIMISRYDGIISGTPEIAGIWQPRVTITDSDGDSVTTTVNFQISQNKFTNSNNGKHEASLMYPINIEPPELVENIPNKEYRISPSLPNGLLLNRTTGIISGRASTISSLVLYTLSIEQGSNIVGKTRFELEVKRDLVPNFPYSTYTVKPDWRVGEEVDIQIPTAIGGDPYIDGGEYLKYQAIGLPTGLTINRKTARITGIPTIANTVSTFRIKVIDRDLDYDYLFVNAKINAPYGKLFSDTITIAPIRFVQNRQSDSIPLPAATEGSGNYTYEIYPTIISGLTFNPVTRVVTGRTSSIARTTSYKYIATDQNGVQDSLAISIEILRDIVSSKIMWMDLETNYHYSINLGRVHSSYIDDIGVVSISPALPNWLNFDAASNILSGTPPSTQADRTLIFTITIPYNEYNYTYELQLDIFSMVQASWERPSRYSSYAYGKTRLVWQNEAFTGWIESLKCRMDSTLQLTLEEKIGENLFTPASGLSLSLRSSDRISTGIQRHTIYLSGSVNYIGTKTYRLVVNVSNGARISTEFNIVSSRRIPLFSTNSFERHQWLNNTSINTQLPTVTNHDGHQVTYTLNPVLPLGLSFNSRTVSITGRSTRIRESVDYTLTATINGVSSTYAFAAGTAQDLEPIFRSTESLSYKFSVNSYRSVSLPSAESGNGNLEYQLSAIPESSNGTSILAQLNYDRTNNTLSGTPNEAVSTTTLTLSVTDSDGDTDTLEIQIIIEQDFPLVISSYSTREIIGYDGVRLSEWPITLSTRGNDPLQHSFHPSLPAGITSSIDFSQSSRTAYVKLEGTPQATLNRSLFTITIRDFDGDFVTYDLYLTIR